MHCNNLKMRIFFFAGYPPIGGHTGSFRLPRRGSTSAPPPPPIRRTSSISTVNKMPLGGDDLPPPPSPSFLQQQQQQHLYGNIGDYPMRSYVEMPHMPSQSRRPPTAEEIYRTSTVADTVRTLSQQPSWKPGEEIYKPVADAMRRQYTADGKGCVADTVRTLTELRHTPASPVQQRRSRASNENLADEELYSRSPAPARKVCFRYVYFHHSIIFYAWGVVLFNV